MNDKNGKRLKIGDHILFYGASGNSYIGIIEDILKYVRVRSSFYGNSASLFLMTGPELIKLTDDQAMLYILENI